MRNKLSTIAAAVMVCQLLLVGVSIAGGTRLFIRSPRSLGMGGAALAVIGDENPFFYNPAILNHLPNARLNILDARFGFNKSFFDQLSYYYDHEKEFKDVEKLSDAEKEKFYNQTLDLARKKAHLSIYGPLPVNYVRRNFGAGVFNRAALDYRIFGGASGIPNVDLAIQGDVLTMVSLSRGFETLLPGRLSVGASAKYLYRWVAVKTQAIPSLSEDIEVFRAGSFGLDLGALYSIKENLIAGVSVYDVVSTKFEWTSNQDSSFTMPPEDKIDATLRLGVAYYPGWQVGGLLKDVVLAFDLDQPFDSDITFFKKVYFGTEASLSPILKVRGGFGQGYPAAGLGLDLRLLRIDYTFYGEELGKYAGQIVVWNHLLRVQLGLGW